MTDKRTDEEMRAMDRFAGIALRYFLEETQLGHMLAEESILLDKVKAKYATLAYDMAEAMLDERQFRDEIDAD
ncbi:hypothetical protein D3C85_569130 [compost metagenome]